MGGQREDKIIGLFFFSPTFLSENHFSPFCIPRVGLIPQPQKFMTQAWPSQFVSPIFLGVTVTVFPDKNNI